MPEDCRSCHKYCLLFLDSSLVLFDLQLVVVQIVVSLYDLKIKQSVHQDRKHYAECKDQNSQPGIYDTMKHFFDFLKQIYLHSFFLLLPVSG